MYDNLLLTIIPINMYVEGFKCKINNLILVMLCFEYIRSVLTFSFLSVQL